jgi:hypothetical protein
MPGPSQARRIDNACSGLIATLPLDTMPWSVATDRRLGPPRAPPRRLRKQSKTTTFCKTARPPHPNRTFCSGSRQLEPLFRNRRLDGSPIGRLRRVAQIALVVLDRLGRLSERPIGQRQVVRKRRVRLQLIAFFKAAAASVKWRFLNSSAPRAYACLAACSGSIAVACATLVTATKNAKERTTKNLQRAIPRKVALPGSSVTYVGVCR